MDPPPCAKGCGFFGSAANKNLCSKCYKDSLKEIITKSAEGLKIESETDNNNGFVPGSSASHKPCASESLADADASSGVSNSNKNRCTRCNKKVGLLGFQCRCGDVFCGRHRYPKEHECKVDFKEMDRLALAKQLGSLCIADKLEDRA